MQSPQPDAELDLIAKIKSSMPDSIADLKSLIEIASIAFKGFDESKVLEAAELVEKLLKDAGVADIERLELEDTAPVIIGRLKVDESLPTVLLYCHYDVVPEGDAEAWHSNPFTATEQDGAIVGRGAADSKSNLIAHIAALRSFEGKPPVNLLFVFEGQEEAGSAFDFYPPNNPELFECDAMIIADVGNIRPGEPSLVTALRGSASVTLEVETLAGPQHSGQFGGAAPDALTVMIHALASLHDASGDVAVAGLMREEWQGAGYTEEEFRELASVLPGVPLQGTRSLGSRIWSGPAITITGIDVADVANAVNAVTAKTQARLDVRVSPWQSAEEAQNAVARHFESVKPFGVDVRVIKGEVGDGVSVPVGGKIYQIAEGALADAYGHQTQVAAVGGSIPIVSALHAAVPSAEKLLFGTADGFSQIHAPNERVLISEFEKSIIAETLFLQRLGVAARSGQEL